MNKTVIFQYILYRPFYTYIQSLILFFNRLKLERPFYFIFLKFQVLLFSFLKLLKNLNKTIIQLLSIVVLINISELEPK